MRLHIQWANAKESAADMQQANRKESAAVVAAHAIGQCKGICETFSCV